MTAETVYGALVTVALLLNGAAVACGSPLRRLLAPLRERRLVVGAVVLDLFVVPLALLGPAAALGVTPEAFAGLVLLAAASTGPIGVALTRIARGDVAATVSIVTALGVANVVTVPALMLLLLDEPLVVPVAAVGRSLVVLLVAPLAVGALVRRVLERRQRHPEAIARTARVLGSASTLVLGGALLTGLAIDPAGILRTAVGAPAVTGLVMVGAGGLGAAVLTRDRRRRRALWLTATARSVGVALAVLALHLPDATDARATVLAVGGLGQGLPLLILLGRDRWDRRRRGRGDRRGTPGGGAARTDGPVRA